MVRVGGTRTAVTVCVLATAAIVVSAGAHVLDRRIGPTGLTRSVSLGRGAQAQHRFPSDVVAQVDLDFIASSPWIPRRFFTVQWEGIVKLRPTAVFDAQYGGFTTGSSPVSWGSIDELFVNLTVPSRGTTHTVRGRRHRHRHDARDAGGGDHWRGGPRASATSTGGVAAVALAPRWPRPTAVPPRHRAGRPGGAHRR